MKPYSENMQHAARSAASLKIFGLQKNESTQRHMMFDEGVKFADNVYQSKIKELEEQLKQAKEAIYRLTDNTK